jgi:hypothetical protein
MSFMWRARAELPPDHQFTVPPSTELGMRVFICIVLGLGVVYGFLIFTTLSRFGSAMDRTWRLRAEAFYAPQMPHTTAPSLPPEYRATKPPVAGRTSTTRPTEPGQDYPGSESPSRDQNAVSTGYSASDPSNLPPAYPPTPNPTTYSKDILNHKSVSPSSPPPLATHRSAQRHGKYHSGRTNTLRGLRPTARSVSPPQRRTYSGSQSSDDQKVSDEDRGRSTIAHSRSHSYLQG